AIGQWIRKDGNLEGLQKVNEDFTKQVIGRSGKDNFTLDTDATFIETEKECAEMTYKGFTAFSSLLSFIADLDLCVHDDYRNGAKHAGAGIEEQIISTHRLIKSLGKKLRYFRSDSAAYKADVFNLCEDKKIIFTIAADQDKAVKEAIKAIPETAWKKLRDEQGKDTGREYAKTIHTMNKTKKAFTLIIQRWANKQPDLFEQEAWRHYVIATNDYERNALDIIRFHNKRGNSENYNKEMKNGFAMEYAPSRVLKANGVYFRLGVLAYNLTIAVKQLFLGKDWIKKTVSTLRWQMIFVAGKVVRHGRKLYLKIAKDYFDLYTEIRRQIAQIPQAGFL
ncbi:MAG: IS1380 family transposase, partial [Elusimicrobiota bacterium]|nr:IS1380 family transposase [Elusimicrobiota bacterium]